MADVQLENGYTRIANDLLEALAVAPWDSASQPRMVLALIRLTYGFQRQTVSLGTADWRALTGLSDRQIKGARGQLHAAGVIVLVRDFDARSNTAAIWQLQKDYSKWGRFAPTLGTSAYPGAAGVPGHTEGTDPGYADVPSLGTQTYPGTCSKPAEDNELQTPKENIKEKVERNVVVVDISARVVRDREEQADEIMKAANRGMAENPRIDQVKPIYLGHASRQDVMDWLLDGVPWELARDTVYRTAKEYPSKDGGQISSMKYFDRPVRNAFELARAEQTKVGADERAADRPGDNGGAAETGSQAQGVGNPPARRYRVESRRAG